MEKRMDHAEEIVSAKDVSEYLGVGEATIYRLAKTGKLPGVRIGNQWRFDLNKIRALFRDGDGTEDFGEVDDETDRMTLEARHASERSRS
jgi:excisionase family DNA binding protein